VKGGKAKKEAAEAKRKADIARKAENARMLAEEVESIKPKAIGAKKKFTQAGGKSAGPGAMAAGGELDSVDEPELKEDEPKEVESFAASGIDNALDLLEVVTAKMDKASVGAQASKIEQHPEVCIAIHCNIYFGSDICRQSASFQGRITPFAPKCSAFDFVS
jgi:hypothetical protein